MDPFLRAQIILLCDLCKTAHLQSHCERCNINLCQICVGEHLSDSSIRHKVVPYKHRKSFNYSKCPDHADELCKNFCEKCDVPVCFTCASSSKHEGHHISDILKTNTALKQKVYKQIWKSLSLEFIPDMKKWRPMSKMKKVELETNYGKLTTAADQQGEVLHGEITAIVNRRKSDIQEIKNKDLSILNKNTDEITQKITELKQIISDMKSILKSNDVSLTSTYKSRNPEFRTLPPKVRVTLPSFSAQKINKDQLNEMFGSPSQLSISSEHDDTMKSAEAVSFPPVKPLLDEPRVTDTIDTGYKTLYSVSCLSEDQVWTRGNNDIMNLINPQSKPLTLIPTKSGNWPSDITVTRGGDLVYTDPGNKTINLVKNKEIQTSIIIHGWESRNVCNTASNDLLVTMISDDYKQSKVVRYSGSTDTQTIQFDDLGRLLYSSDYSYKYISENKNLDICVADYTARAVVVVNQSGKLRFRYTGHPSNTEDSFDPIGITTDSQSHILTADHNNNRIHILD